MYLHLIEYTWVYYIPLFGNCSEGELLCTEPSLSPLSLLRSNFGIDISNGLHELNVHEGTLHLTGYMSSPYGGYNFKVALKSSFHSFLFSSFLVRVFFRLFLFNVSANCDNSILQALQYVCIHALC